MTHLLPPNLLKLFAPRPQLPYARPVGKDPDRVRSKNVGGMANVLAQVREEDTVSLLSKVKKEDEAMEEGEEKTLTHAEETLREIRREERKKQKEEQFKMAKDSCQCCHERACHSLTILMQISPLMIARPLVIHTKLFSSLDWYARDPIYLFS